MKVGVLTVLFGDKPLSEILEYLSEKDVEAIELPGGGFSSSGHFSTEEVLEDEEKQNEILDLVDDHDMEISAISSHGNPLHPQEEKAKSDDKVLRKSIELADKMNVDVVNGFSGCPGASEDANHPNWITAPWPSEFKEVLEWQWEKKLIPYWKEIAKLADEHGINIGLEMHPNFSVYNPETLLKLRNNTNDRIGANFDPSHLIWQDIDPERAIRKLGEKNAIYHFHAKDVRIYKQNSSLNGVLDTKSYTKGKERSWIFRSVGYGHGEEYWRNIVSVLRMVGYNGVLSIEHEDLLADPLEGLEKAIEVLKKATLTKEPGEAYWA
ncbi:MAG: sugar phosphate isomerase/epimerase family protein [Candidatus Hadarchaeia archaeon]